MTDTARKRRLVAFYLIAALATLPALCLLVWHSSGRHNPIVLDDGTSSVLPSSWKTIPINVPYGGNLDVSVRAISGGLLDVTFIDEDQMAKLDDCMSPQRVCRFDFAVVNTSSYAQNSQIRRGHYFLVLRNASSSGRSSVSLDVAVKVTLHPKLFTWILSSTATAGLDTVCQHT